MHSHPQMGQMHHRQYGAPMGHQPHPQMQHRGYAPIQQQHQPPPQMHHRLVHQGKIGVLQSSLVTTI